MIKREELDRKTDTKTRVQLQIIFPDVKTYKTHANTFRAIANDTKSNMAVKMV